MPDKLKKRVSAVFETGLYEQVDKLRKTDKRSFSSMLEILVTEAIRHRLFKK